MIKRTAAALLLALTFAAAGFAQEYGRSSGGVIAATTKTPSTFSGSLDFGLPFLSSQGARRSGGTFGGALVKDRVWFFSSLEKMDVGRFSGATLNALPTDRQSLGATFRAERDLVAVQPSLTPLTVPSSFLSLHYTGIVSSNTFFNATFSEHR